MLTLSFESETQKNQDLFKKFDLSSQGQDSVIVFYDDETAVGFCKFSFEGLSCVIQKMAFLDEVDSGDINFFARATLFKLSQCPGISIVFKGSHPELELFDFVEIDGDMVCKSEDINLHKGCNH